jgi:hypothetical protein
MPDNMVYGKSGVGKYEASSLGARMGGAAPGNIEDLVAEG